MSIKDELAVELKDAMRTGDRRRRDVIRQIETEVSLARSAPGFEGEVDDSLYRETIAAYVKKMRKAVEEYRAAGERGREMAEKLAFEVDYLERWLPRRRSEAETRELVRSAIDELGAGGDPKAAGRVTGHVMKAHGGEVDGAVVARLAREELGG